MNERNKNIDKDVVEVIPENQMQQDVEDGLEEQQKQETIDRGLWYIIQCFTGHEYKVQQHIQLLVEDPRYKDYLYRVLVPFEETVEIKNNKRVEKTVRMYPGYVFVQMEFNEYVCYEIQKVPGVAKFIGGTRLEPTPVSDIDILKVLRKVGDKTKTMDVDFEVNEEIKVIDGPFRGYSGLISEINVDRGTLKARISIFGRETPVELDFDQVEKII